MTWWRRAAADGGDYAEYLGFGDVESGRVFVRNELIPSAEALQELNDGVEDVEMRFEDYNLGIE
ncbi:hypothetical protein KCP70_04890 [Salmonella enterica subsp. enterica]|nr:hypothetical protein KCP70_04890 [Salmonella enterica subsp. enterica]